MVCPSDIASMKLSLVKGNKSVMKSCAVIRDGCLASSVLVHLMHT
jgi:hypothetical protein